MWYIPFLRAYRAFVTYGIIVIGVAIVSSAIRFTPGVHVSAHDTAHVSLEFMSLANLAAGLLAVLATIMGLSLASENDGHLEVAWTKPVSRERYALGIFTVDIIAMIGAYILTLVALFVVTDIWAGKQAVFTEHPLWQSAAIFLLPVYIYALIALGSASLKRSRGMVAGLFWPVVAGLVGLEAIQIDSVHAIAHIINTVNPVVVFSTRHGIDTPPANYLLGLGLTAIALTLAVVQWKRLEA
jgi:hypothetical protein